MADEQEKTEQTKDKSKDKGKKPLLIWVGMAVAALLAGAGGGYVASKVLFRPAETAAQVPIDDSGEYVLPSNNPELIQDDIVYYEFDPLTVNLNTPRANRYVKVVLLLGTPKDLQQEVNSAIDSKKEPLKNMLITYFSGHTLDEVSGDKNVTRIQREIAEEFNRRLWADGKPRIQEVLFKEWAIH